MSALLSESDLNDFISPGLACIKPAGEIRANQSKVTEIQIGSNGEAMEVSIDDGTVSNLPSASISLQDCLACSGCITSAEEVLLGKQTHKVLLEDLEKYKGEKVFCLSISHQTRVSLSDFLRLTINKVDQFLMNFFSEKFGFRFIVGTELSRIISTQKQNEEILRFKQTGETKPYLSAICPGFVLYVEKTKPEILPYLLNVKSPQQITGLLLKALISKQMNIDRTKVYHLSIMPCFDKKLEASRPEIESTEAEDMDVDCVLTPKELVEMLKEIPNLNILNYITKDDLPPLELYRKAAPCNWPTPVENWSSNLGSTSGGYALNYILFLKQHYSAEHPNSEIKEIKGKNSDVYEYQLWDGETKLGSSAVIHGFRNIQNLVRKLKPSGKVKVGSGLQARRKARISAKKGSAGNVETADPAQCDFVEVMACPGGCINGGGITQTQTQTQGTALIDEEQRELTEREHLNTLTAKYEEFEKVDVLAGSELLGKFIREFRTLFNITEERMIRYKFNKIDKATDILSVGSKW